MSRKVDECKDGKITEKNVSIQEYFTATKLGDGKYKKIQTQCPSPLCGSSITVNPPLLDHYTSGSLVPYTQRHECGCGQVYYSTTSSAGVKFWFIKKSKLNILKGILSLEKGKTALPLILEP